MLFGLNFLCQFHLLQFTSMEPYVSCEVFNEQTVHYSQSVNSRFEGQQMQFCRGKGIAMIVNCLVLQN